MLYIDWPALQEASQFSAKDCSSLIQHEPMRLLEFAQAGVVLRGTPMTRDGGACSKLLGGVVVVLAHPSYCLPQMRRRLSEDSCSPSRRSCMFTVKPSVV
ncbi:unnamed protein product [Closterium sp. NIES-54]